MKRPLVIMFVVFVWHSVHICAYDFIGVAKKTSSPILYYYYCNIISDENSEIPTCEITYSDKKEIDGMTVYNQDHEFGGHEYIPEKLIHNETEYTVIGIGDHAFQDLPDNLPEGISIGYFSGLSASVKYIGKEAFKNWGSLYSMNINGVEMIGEGAFENCNRLTFVEFPNETEVKNKCHISFRAFHGCNRLIWFCVNAMLPSFFEIEKDAFDVIDGKIKCSVITIDDELVSLYKAVADEPWILFSEICGISERPSGPSNIETVYGDDRTDEQKYDLQGRPIFGTPNGIYIYNGKKYIDKY